VIDVSLISRVPWLAALNQNARRELAARAAQVRLAPGEVLWTAGSRPRGLFVIVAGRVRAVRGRDGRQRVVHVEGPGGTLGEVPVFGGGRYPATVMALESSVCLVLAREALEAAIAADVSLAFALLERMAQRVRTVVDRFDRATGIAVEARLAAFLLERHAASGGEPFALGPTQMAVAEEIGTVREVLVRVLRRLRESGAIRALGRGRYQVTDAAALRRIER
jgi:CRP/FNR family transcriptional regulator